MLAFFKQETACCFSCLLLNDKEFLVLYGWRAYFEKVKPILIVASIV